MSPNQSFCGKKHTAEFVSVCAGLISVNTLTNVFTISFQRFIQFSVVCIVLIVVVLTIFPVKRISLRSFDEVINNDGMHDM